MNFIEGTNIYIFAAPNLCTMKTDFDYFSYQEGKRQGMKFGLLLGTIIGLATAVAAVFIITVF